MLTPPPCLRSRGGVWCVQGWTDESDPVTGTGAAMKFASQLFVTMMASFVGPLYMAPRLRRAGLMWLHYPVAFLPLVLLVLLVLSLLIDAD